MMTAFGIALQKAHSHRTISGFEKYLWRYQTVVGPQMEIANVTFRPTLADFTELFAKLVEQSLSLWEVPEDARVRLINV